MNNIHLIVFFISLLSLKTIINPFTHLIYNDKLIKYYD